MNARMAVSLLSADILYDLLNILTKTQRTGVPYAFMKKNNAENKKENMKKGQRNENQPKSKPKKKKPHETQEESKWKQIWKRKE